jgi:hypothetical protein
MTTVVASGTVRVRSLRTGDEWDETVDVAEEDMDWYIENVHVGITVEDAAREQAERQACEPVETLEVDIS